MVATLTLLLAVVSTGIFGVPVTLLALWTAVRSSTRLDPTSMGFVIALEIKYSSNRWGSASSVWIAAHY